MSAEFSAHLVIGSINQSWFLFTHKNKNKVLLGEIS
jgi:hypothetical protein